MKSITEEMRFRQRLCEYALKHGVTKAARRYHTYRQLSAEVEEASAQPERTYGRRTEADKEHA